MPLAVDLDPDTRTLVIEALRAAADQRSRAATRAAGELADEKADGTITDERPGAVKIARWLADASRLVRAADAIAGAGPSLTPDDVDRAVARATAGDRPAWAPVDDIAELILATFPNVGPLAANGIAWAVHGGAFDAAPSSPPAGHVEAAVEEPAAAAPAPVAMPAPRAATKPPPPAGANGKVSVAQAADTTHAVLQDLGMTFTAADRELDLDDLEELDEFDDGQTPEDRAGLADVDANATWAAMLAPTPAPSET